MPHSANNYIKSSSSRDRFTPASNFSQNTNLKRREMTSGSSSPSQAFNFAIQPTNTLTAPITNQKQCLFYVQTCQVNQNGKLVVSRKKEAKEKRKRNKASGNSAVSNNGACSVDNSPTIVEFSQVSSPPKRVKQESYSNPVKQQTTQQFQTTNLPKGPSLMAESSVTCSTTIRKSFSYPNVQLSNSFLLPSVSELLKSIENTNMQNDSLVLPNVLVNE